MQERKPSVTISVCEDGPLLVRGDFELQRMADSQRIDAKRAVVALCRCGRSQIKPFCDGSHSIPPRRTAGQTAQPQQRGTAPSFRPSTGT
jgi:CDGSH-type Zn-finger protein